MTWWLSASSEELTAASTCQGCGCPGADIDLNLCFDCFGRLSRSEQWRRSAAIARKYGDYKRAADFEEKAMRADADAAIGLEP